MLGKMRTIKIILTPEKQLKILKIIGIVVIALAIASFISYFSFKFLSLIKINEKLRIDNELLKNNNSLLINESNNTIKFLNECNITKKNLILLIENLTKSNSENYIKINELIEERDKLIKERDDYKKKYNNCKDDLEDCENG